MRIPALIIPLFLWLAGRGQREGLLLSGGHLIDPKNRIDTVMDIRIRDGRILAEGFMLSRLPGERRIDARGLYIVPGLIDIHTHLYFGKEADREFDDGPESVIPDEHSFQTGVTTLVDAGSTGWRDFLFFKHKVIDHSRTRVLAFLNIVGSGMRGDGPEQNLRDMDARLAALTARKYRDRIVGIKLAHYNGPGWAAVDAAIAAGVQAQMPVMIDFGSHIPPLSLDTLFMAHMRPGDIFTHCFAQLSSRESIVDTVRGMVRPFVWRARQKGIIFDLGYGSISMAFSQAVPAIRQHCWPGSLSTDMHVRSLQGTMKDLLHVMSMMLAIGMDRDSVIAAVTWGPAQAIHRPELGHCTPGAIADLTILRIREGRFRFADPAGSEVTGDKRFECVMTVKGGRVVYSRLKVGWDRDLH